MIDIHTHLYFPQYDEDRDETIRRAFDSGITRMISVGTEPDDWEKVLAVTEYDERITAAVGIHPHWYNAELELRMKNKELSKNTEDPKNAILELRECIAKHREKIVAIGECGLDYFSRVDSLVSEEQKIFQKEGFLEQMRLAREFSLPLIIHTRPSAGSMDAYADMFEILAIATNEANQKAQLTIILHCYMGDTEITEQFLTLPNVYFSFTGTITYPAKKVLEETKDDPCRVVRMIPLDRILTETDCPFLAPQSHRGERNEPRYVHEVAVKIAEIKGVGFDEINDCLETNVQRIFPIRTL